MSSGQKACVEDEEAWDDFKNDSGINGVTWDVYSLEAKFAKEGYRSYAFTDTILKKYVAINMEFERAKQLYVSKLNKLKEIQAI